ncbi:MAG TPA: hypothetical protein VHO92_03050 [Methanobacterium sp.]|nr:hypothetical protein [Methanobacterium sp.]
MKIKLGVILLALLATVGFSGAMAAQHVEEGHSNRHSHGPPRSNISITSTNRCHNSSKCHFRFFQKNNKLIK